MAIIYPPYIADTIPAFVKINNNNVLIKIPFEDNPGVGSSYAGIAVQIKEYLSSENVGNTIYVRKSGLAISNGIVKFNVAASSFNNLQYYKFQIGYIENWNNRTTENITYSSISIGRYIGTHPIVIISNDTQRQLLNPPSTNNNQGVYFGIVYNNNENIYSYQFKLFSDDEDLIETSGEILNTNNNYKYKIKHQIGASEICYLQFIVTTINGYIGESSKYPITNESELPETCSIKSISAKQDGSIKIDFNIIKEPYSMQDRYFLLERTTDKINYEELVIFKAQSDQIPTQKDYSIEQGVPYYYSIREVDENGVYISSRYEIETPISADYENIVLVGLDGKVLNIRFDPKVSSFKNVILEQKTDTIGSKYPFFFRNGDVNYKEIPISGLISYHMDENETFMTDEELGFPYTISTAAAGARHTSLVNETIGRNVNLSGANIAAERKFRLAVLEWLTNGEPKLFRSPTEGVYVIRLMNVSLTPNDTLGRMLYSFSSTGYEVAESDVESLIKNKYVEFIEDYTNMPSILGYFILGASRLASDNSGEEEVEV